MKNQEATLTGKVFFYLGWIIGLALLYFAFKEGSYYVSSSVQRPLHPHATMLRSSGVAGLSFGMAGTVLIFLNLTYLIRRRLIHWTWLGALRHWMTFHVFTGFIGGALVLLHSTFIPRSSLGTLAFVSLIITLITGLLGRFIYSHVPRSLEGQEMEMDQILKQMNDMRVKAEALGLRHQIFQIPSVAATGASTDKGVLSSLMMLLSDERKMKREFHQIQTLILKDPSLKSGTNQLLDLAKRFLNTQQWFRRYYELRSLMSSWRFFHRWFAILMLITILFHIGVAVQMGDLWIFHLGVRNG